MANPSLAGQSSHLGHDIERGLVKRLVDYQDGIVWGTVGSSGLSLIGLWSVAER